MNISSYITFAVFSLVITGAIMFISGSKSALCKTAAALTMTAVIITPLHKIKTEAFDIMRHENEQLRETVSEAAEQGRALYSSAAAEKIGEYAEAQAKKNGIEIKARINAYADSENNFEIKSARIEYGSKASYLQKSVVENMLLNDCGISLEKQQHIVPADSTG